MPQWMPLAASTSLSVIPVVIWLIFLSKEGGDRKSIYIKTFLIGTFSVVPPFILMFLFSWKPELDIYSLINKTVEQAILNAVITNVVVAVIEELGKNMIVRFTDKRHPEFLQTIGSALKLSICAGLGFSFAENIFYFYNIWTSPMYGTADLFSSFIFRSLFTMCMHMAASSIFGYYFGLGKFAGDISELARYKGESIWFTRLIGKLTGRMPFQVIRENKNLEGLFLAISIHATFNALLTLEYKMIPILIVVVSGIYIAYLFKRKSGNLLLSVLKRRGSTLAASDEDVVMEFIGMALNEGKLEEVVQICDRLLVRDPDNNVVKLFKAQARDKLKLKQFYDSLKGVFSKTKAPAVTVAPEGIKTPASALMPAGKSLSAKDEKIVLEVMDMWFKAGNYKQTLEIANRLLSLNPQSEGAKVLMEKAMDKTKLERVFESLGRLFGD